MALKKVRTQVLFNSTGTPLTMAVAPIAQWFKSTGVMTPGARIGGETTSAGAFVGSNAVFTIPIEGADVLIIEGAVQPVSITSVTLIKQCRFFITSSIVWHDGATEHPQLAASQNSMSLMATGTVKFGGSPPDATAYAHYSASMGGSAGTITSTSRVSPKGTSFSHNGANHNVASDTDTFDSAVIYGFPLLQGGTTGRTPLVTDISRFYVQVGARRGGGDSIGAAVDPKVSGVSTVYLQMGFSPDWTESGSPALSIKGTILAHLFEEYQRSGR